MTFKYNGPLALLVIAETAAEVIAVFKHFGLDKGTEGVLAMAQAVQAGRFEHTAAATGKRPWFEVDVYLDKALDPYRKLLKSITGYDGPIPNIDLTDVHHRRLCATHITDVCAIVDGMYYARTFIRAEESNDQPAEVRADKNAADYAQEDIGKRRFEREFISNASGNFSPNPNYGRAWHAAEPGLGAPWLWKRLFAWWRANEASERQRAVLDAVDKLHDGSRYERDYEIRKGGGDEAGLVGYTLYALDPAGTINYDGKGKMASVYSWDEFKAMGTGVTK